MVPIELTIIAWVVAYIIYVVVIGGHALADAKRYGCDVLDWWEWPAAMLALVSFVFLIVGLLYLMLFPLYQYLGD
jgi:hypothetical protein